MSGSLLPPDCSVGPGVADVVVTDIGGRNPIVLEASEIGPAWERNQPSSLLVEFPLDALTADFQPLDALTGRWITWYGNALGTWSGVIDSVEPDPSSGSAQVSGTDFSRYLTMRNLPKSNKVITGCAGGLADVLCKYAEQDDTLWLSAVDYEDAGDFLSVQLTGQNLLQQLQQNADDSDQEFRVDETRTLRWRRRLGRDLTNTVQLTEGVEIANAKPSWDTTDVVNDLIIAPAQDNYAARYARRVEDVASVRQIGRRQATATTRHAIRPSAIRSIGQRQAARSAALGRTLSLDVVNANECFASFREGDTVRVVLPSINLACDLLLLQRSYTVSDGVLLLTGEMQL